MKKIILMFIAIVYISFGDIAKIHQEALNIYREGNVVEAIQILEDYGIEYDEVFEEGVSNKKAAMILNDYAYFLMKVERYEESKDYLLYAMKYDENRASIYYNLLELRDKVKGISYDEEQEYAKKYLNLTKKEKYISFDKFDNFSFENTPQEIRDVLVDRDIKKVFIENKLLPDSYIKKGWQTYNEGNLLRAEMSFIRALDMDENYAPSYEGLISVYMKTNQEMEAKEYARRYFLLVGKEEDVYLNEKNEIVLTDKIPEIVKSNLTKEEQVEVLSTLDYIPNLYLNLGEKYIEKGKLDEGKEYLKKYLEYKRNNTFEYTGTIENYRERRIVLPVSIEKHLNRLEILDIIYAKAGINLEDEVKKGDIFIEKGEYFISFKINGKTIIDPIESFLPEELLYLKRDVDYIYKYAINTRKVYLNKPEMIKHLSLLKYMPYLEDLDISTLGLKDIEFMREMPFKKSLKIITSKGNMISDYSLLGEFQNLKMIDVYMNLESEENNIDLTYLNNCFSLEWISFRNVNFKVNDLSFLGNKPRLKNFASIRYTSLNGLEKMKGYNLYFEVAPLSEEELYKYKGVFSSGIFHELAMYDSSFRILASSDFREFLLDVPIWIIYHTNDNGEIEEIEEIKDYDKQVLLDIFGEEGE